MVTIKQIGQALEALKNDAREISIGSTSITDEITCTIDSLQDQKMEEPNNYLDEMAHTINLIGIELSQIKANIIRTANLFELANPYEINEPVMKGNNGN